MRGHSGAQPRATTGHPANTVSGRLVSVSLTPSSPLPLSRGLYSDQGSTSLIGHSASFLKANCDMYSNRGESTVTEFGSNKNDLGGSSVPGATLWGGHLYFHCSSSNPLSSSLK